MYRLATTKIKIECIQGIIAWFYIYEEHITFHLYKMTIEKALNEHLDVMKILGLLNQLHTLSLKNLFKSLFFLQLHRLQIYFPFTHYIYTPSLIGRKGNFFLESPLLLFSISPDASVSTLFFFLYFYEYYKTNLRKPSIFLFPFPLLSI